MHYNFETEKGFLIKDVMCKALQFESNLLITDDKL